MFELHNSSPNPATFPKGGPKEVKLIHTLYRSDYLQKTFQKCKTSSFPAILHPSPHDVTLKDRPLLTPMLTILPNPLSIDKSFTPSTVL